MIYGFKKREHEEFPPIVHVETTNVCNLKCIHCPQSNLSSVPGYKPQYMDSEIFGKIVKEVAEHRGVLRFTPDGEPMIHPEWMKQVDLILNSGVGIFCFNTNGILMDNERMDVLFQETETKIAVEFSIDALYPRTYKKIRGGDYEKLLHNLFHFIEKRQRMDRSNIKILVSCIIQPELKDGEYSSFVEFWEPIADKVITRQYVDTKGLTPKKNTNEAIPTERWPCPVLFTRIVIGIDGKIRFCPDDWLKQTVIGDISRDSIRETWMSERFSFLRKSHLEGNFSHDVCRRCSDWVALKWDNNYLKALDDLFKKQ